MTSLYSLLKDGFSLSTQKTKQINNDTFTETVTTNQTTAFNAGGTNDCEQIVDISNCRVGTLNVKQKATCIDNMDLMQDSIQSQTTTSSLTSKLMDNITQSTPSIGLPFSKQQVDVINNLRINLATEVQQATLMDCFVNSTTLNRVTCNNSSIVSLQVDQNAFTDTTVKCVQSATENSQTTSTLDSTVENIVTQKVTNALWSLAVLTLAAGCVLMVVFIGPGADVAMMTKGLMKEPEGMMMMVFLCVVVLAFCNAMSVSRSYLFDINLQITRIVFPPQIKQKYWDDIWIATCIYVIVVMAFAYYRATSNNKKNATSSSSSSSSSSPHFNLSSTSSVKKK